MSPDTQSIPFSSALNLKEKLYFFLQATLTEHWQLYSVYEDTFYAFSRLPRLPPKLSFRTQLSKVALANVCKFHAQHWLV